MKKTEQSERFLRAAAGLEARPPHAENTFLSLSLMSVDIACNVALRRGPERDPKLGTTLSNPVYKLYKTERLIPPELEINFNFGSLGVGLLHTPSHPGPDWHLAGQFQTPNQAQGRFCCGLFPLFGGRLWQVQSTGFRRLEVRL